MATETLTLPNVTSSQSLITPSQTSLSMFQQSAIKSVDYANEQYLRATNSKPVNRSISAETHAHVYVNLPHQFLIGGQSLKTSEPESMKCQAQPYSTIPHTKMCTSVEFVVSNPTEQKTLDTHVGGYTAPRHSDKFCWSPRCPPDGAAFHENSASGSSVSSSPIAKFNRDSISVRAGGSNMDRLCSSPKPTRNTALNDQSTDFCKTLIDVLPHFERTIPEPKFEHSTVSHCSGNGNVVPRKQPIFQQPDQIYPSVCSSDLVHVTWSANVPVASICTPNRPVARPTHAISKRLSPCPPKTESTTYPTCDIQVHSHLPCSDRHPDNFDNLTDSSYTLESACSPKLPDSPTFRDQQFYCPTPPLPPPPSPPVAPAIPPRDPATVLRQNGPYNLLLGIPTTVLSTDSTTISTSFKSNALTQKSNGSVPATKHAVTYETDARLLSRRSNEHPPDSRADPESSQSPGVSSHSLTPSLADMSSKFVHSSPRPVISRPVATTISQLPESSTTALKVEATVHQSPTNVVADGRSVVPWNSGRRAFTHGDRGSIDAIQRNTVVSEAVSIALAMSTSFSADTPQWVPPDPSVIRHRFLSHSSNRQTDFVHSSIPNECSSDFEFTTRESYIKREAARRPNCLIGQDPTSLEKVKLFTRRNIPKYPSSQSERASRRYHTTSELEAFQPICQKPTHDPVSPVCTPTDHNAHCTTMWMTDSIAESVNITRVECQPLSPTEAEWWRAQQRSQLIASGYTQHSKRSGTVGDDIFFQRQFSAGPVFSISPTKPMVSPEMSSASLDLVRSRVPLSDTLCSVSHSNHGYQIDDNGGVSSCELRSAFAGQRAGIPRSWDDHPDTARMTLHSHVSARSSDQLRSTDFDRASGYPSSMAQSVFYASDFGRSSMTQLTPDDVLISHVVRRRRSKNGITRSHSHRTADQVKSRQLISESDCDIGKPSFSVDYYQRSTSQTVPSEMSCAHGIWPPLLVQWHHRRPLVFDSDISHEQIAPRRVDARDSRHARTGRSSNDLSNSDGMKRVLTHHLSASAICDRLDMQSWFHFDLSRASAERILKSTRVGSFLVRHSETNASEFSLSIRRDNDVLHMKISHDPQSGQYVLGEYSQPYPSIAAMIHRYTRSLLPVRGTTPILLRFPVSRDGKR